MTPSQSRDPAGVGQSKINSFSSPKYTPFIKWVGGKSALLAQYARLFPRGANRYFEPFLGSGAVFFYLRGLNFAREYYLSDVNPELVNVYRVMQSSLDGLIDCLAAHKEQHGADHYYAVRAMDREDITRYSDVERAARMIYLNRTCYNGLWRVNSKGHFNVPMGDYANPAILDERRLRKAAEALSQAGIRLAGFESVLETASKGDFVYFDPPYVPLSSTASFTSYASADFGEADQEQLAEVFHELDTRGCNVMLSNSDTPVVRDLFAGFRIEIVQAARRINSDSTKRGEINEIVALNY